MLIENNIYSGSNSQLSQDLYAFKVFKSLCRSKNINEDNLCEEIVKLVNNLHTDIVRQQVFDYITTSKHITQNVIIEFLKSFQIILKEKGKY